jgi:hypothetical protein
MLFLAQSTNFSGGNLIQEASQVSQAVAQGFDTLWTQTITGTLYGQLCQVGILFAVATLTLFMVDWTVKMLNGDEQRAFADFIWPLVVVVLLANNGTVLGQGTLGIRNYINNINNFVLQSTAAGTSLSQAYQQALGVDAARNAIGQAIQQCESASEEPQDAVSCLQDAQTNLTQQYPQYFNNGNGPFSWFTDAVNNIVQAPIDALNNGANPLQVIFSPFSAMIGSAVDGVISVILMGLSGAYQWAIELTMLVTALIGPLAVGGSLLPYGSKAVFAWAIGYFSVGLGKLCFNIIVGLAGQIVASSQSDQPLFFLFVIGIFAPFLATGLAAGGGIAVFMQINKAAEFYGSAAIKISTAVITNGASATANKITPGE